jgi:hypothetical protein
MTTKLKARVRGVNRAHAYANELFPRLREAFTPFLEKQIETKNGPLLAKVQKVVESLALPYGVDLSVYRHSSNYSLAYTVKTCEVLDGHAYYYEITIYIGSMDVGILTKLTKLSDVPHYKDDYSAEEVETARLKYRAAKAVADELHGKLHPFGEYDQ